MLKRENFLAALKKSANSETGGYAAKRIAVIQRRVADYLNTKTAGWSPVKMKIALMLFCLVSGTASLYLAGKAVLRSNSPPVFIAPKQIHLPKDTRGTGYDKAH